MEDIYKDATKDKAKKVNIIALPSYVFFLHKYIHNNIYRKAPIKPVLNKKC